MEAMLARIPNFALGSGWKGMVEGVQRSGSVPEAVVGGVVGIGENVAWNSLFAASGVGLKGIGKMASLGLAQSFFNAAKEGRTPTVDEMTDSTTQAAMLGVVFTALPHLAEGSQIEAEKRALKRYEKKVQAFLEPTEIARDAAGKPLEVNGPVGGTPETSVGGNKAFEIDPIAVAKKEGLLQQIKVLRDKRGLVKTAKEKQEIGFQIDSLEFQAGMLITRKEVSTPVVPQTIDPAKATQIVYDIVTDPAIRPELRRSLAQPFLDRLDQRGDIAPPEFKLGQWKDPSKLRMLMWTMERTIEKVDRASAPEVRDFTTEKIKENEAYHKRWQTDINNAIQKKELVPKGITPNSDAAMYMMRYGEGRMTEAELQKASPDKWGEIEQGAAWSRKIYDETLTALNTVREAAGKEPIVKRPDYFRHFQEMSLASDLFGHFWGEGKNAPTSIAGIINKAKYGSPFNPTEMQRRGSTFKEDGVLALQNYVKSVGPQLFHTDSVQRVRALENYIRTQALIGETQLAAGKPYVKVDLSNFVTRLSNYADMLAGQPSKLTTAINNMAVSEHWLDRTAAAGINALRKNTALNMIGYNISAGTMNILPLAQQIATTRTDFVARGWTTSFLHLVKDVPFVLDGARSDFYDRRYPQGFLPANWYESIVDKGYVLPNVIDRMTVQALIAGKYYEGRAQGLEPDVAMKAADNYAVRAVTDRTTGQLPQAMSEPNAKLFSMFQVEINNLWSWMGHDLAGDRQLTLKGKMGRMVIFALACNVLNTVYEKTMGRRPQLDPLEILGTLAGITKEGRDRSLLERVGPAYKMTMGNVPFGNLFVDGGRFPMTAAYPDLHKAFGDSENIVWSEFLKPLYFASPFGGGAQVRKTIEGVTAWNRGYVATPSGKTKRYGVEHDFANGVRGFLFGKNAFPEAVDYWAKPPEERD